MWQQLSSKLKRTLYSDIPGNSEKLVRMWSISLAGTPTFLYHVQRWMSGLQIEHEILNFLDLTEYMRKLLLFLVPELWGTTHLMATCLSVNSSIKVTQKNVCIMREALV